jgi:hypothetical protein
VAAGAPICSERHLRGHAGVLLTCHHFVNGCCSQKFSVRHALECKQGDLVISCHNEIRGELSDLALNCNEPKIHTCCTPEEVKSDEENKKNSAVKHLFRNNGNGGHDDILICGLWARGTDCIIDVQIVDADAKPNRSEDLDKVSAAHEREKEKKCLGACLEQRRHFSLFVVSVDGLLGKEAKFLLIKLSAMLAEKWEKPCSEVCGRVNAPMSIAIVRATHLCVFVDHAFRQAKCATASRSGRTKQVSAFSNIELPMPSPCSLSQPPCNNWLMMLIV